ncbi:hypothetical protein [Thermovirga sp.]|uniref:hypothetical protein n=1 Tax=Thermovirga sp. TaxID=2699834 RepID=UPI0025F1B1C0|nr:hypothetical protein [Thermovirga sp.]MBO8154703.1 hypothetical protein [Thermovirga sp.]
MKGRLVNIILILLIFVGIVEGSVQMCLAEEMDWNFPSIGFGNGYWYTSVGAHFWKDHLEFRNLQLGLDVDLWRGLRLHGIFRSNDKKYSLQSFSPRVDELYLEWVGFYKNQWSTLSVSAKLGRSRYLRFPYPDAISLFDQVPGIGDLEGGEGAGYSGIVVTADYFHDSGFGLHGTYIDWGFGEDRPSNWAEAFLYYYLDDGPYHYELRWGKLPVRPEPLGRTAEGFAVFAGKTYKNGNSIGFLYEDCEGQDRYTGIVVSFAPGDTTRWMGELAFDFTRSPLGHAMQIPLISGTIGSVVRAKKEESPLFSGLYMERGSSGWLEAQNWQLVGEIKAERIRTYWQNGQVRNFYEHRISSWGVTDGPGLKVVMVEEPWYLQLEALVSPHTDFSSWEAVKEWEKDRQGPAQLNQKVTYRFYRKKS